MDEKRPYPGKLEFDSEYEIPPGAQTVMTVRPKYPFRGDTLQVNPGLPQGFTITDITVGLFNQLIEEVPAEIFDGKIESMLDVCQPVDDFKITVFNGSKEAARFTLRSRIPIGGKMGRKPMRCSICESPQHRANKCPEREEKMKENFEKGRHSALGFKSHDVIHAGAIERIVSRPMLLFKGERLAIPASLAGHFEITNIAVGMRCQMVDVNPIPAELFSSPRDLKDYEVIGLVDVDDKIARGERFDLEPCYPGMDYIIEVVNIDVAPYQFRAAIFGRVPLL